MCLLLKLLHLRLRVILTEIILVRMAMELSLLQIKPIQQATQL